METKGIIIRTVVRTIVTWMESSMNAGKECDKGDDHPSFHNATQYHLFSSSEYVLKESDV